MSDDQPTATAAQHANRFDLFSGRHPVPCSATRWQMPAR
jgi:hypothetical protein